MDDMKTYTESRHPWLSIIIPVYNAEKFLKKCLDSIMMQSYTNYEIILIDDGSVDSSSDICREYARCDNRVRYFWKENGGSYQARIYGAEQASGTYIIFCDADDYYATKDAFMIMHNALVREEYSALQFGYVRKYNHLKRSVKPVKRAKDVVREEFVRQEYPKLLCNRWESSCLTTTVWDKVYHRKLFTNLPDSCSAEKVFWGDDLIFNLHILNTCDAFRYIPDILYCYQQLSGGTNRFSARTMKDMDSVKKYQLLFLKHYQGGQKREIKARLFAEVAAWFFAYVQQAIEYLDETELRRMITETLSLPNVVLARQYYLNESDEEWEAVRLLREASPDQYISKVKEYWNRRTMKEKFIGILKQIYYKL